MENKQSLSIISSAIVFSTTLILSTPLILSASAFAETIITQKTYEGKLGKTSIVLQTLETPNKAQLAGSYFYNSQRININLIPASKKPLVFNEMAPDCTYIVDDCKTTAKISLNNIGEDLSGNWKSIENGKTYPIELKLITKRSFSYDNDIKNNDDLLSLYVDEIQNPRYNPYLQKMATGALNYSKEAFIGPYGYKIASDKLSGIHYPTISSAKNNINIYNINETLKSQLLTLVSYGLDCKAQTTKESSWDQFGDWQDYDSTPIHATDKVLVIEEGGSTYCGGAYPNNSYSHRIFAIATGKELSTSDLFNIYNTKEYDKVKSDKFAALYDKMLKNSKYSYEGMADDENTKECLSDDSWMPLSAWPSKNGVVFSLEDTPHVMGACMGDYYIVSYKEMLPFMTPLAKQLFAKEIAASK